MKEFFKTTVIGLGAIIVVLVGLMVTVRYIQATVDALSNGMALGYIMASPAVIGVCFIIGVILRGWWYLIER